MSAPATFAELVRDTAPPSLRELALAYVVAEQADRDALNARCDPEWDYDHPSYQAYSRRCDRADAAKCDAADALKAAFDALGIDALLRDKLGMYL